MRRPRAGPAGVRTGWAEARIGPHRPYVPRRKEENLKTAGGQQNEKRREREESEEKAAKSRQCPIEGGAGVLLAKPAQA